MHNRYKKEIAPRQNNPLGQALAGVKVLRAHPQWAKQALRNNSVSIN